MRKSILPRSLKALSASAILIGFPTAASAHDFGRDNDFYARFTEGVSVILNDVPLILATLAIGILVSIWHPREFPRSLPFLAAGIIVGFFLPMASISQPEYFSLAVAVIVGLLGAAALKIPAQLLRVICFFAGLALTAGTLGGHEPGTVPTGAYFGILLGLVLVTSAAATGASIAIEKSGSQVSQIALRALSSWLVAIAVMMIALMLRPSPV